MDSFVSLAPRQSHPSFQHGGDAGQQDSDDDEAADGLDDVEEDKVINAMWA